VDFATLAINYNTIDIQHDAHQHSYSGDSSDESSSPKQQTHPRK